MPPNTVYVGRPSKWGNPFTVQETGSADLAVEQFRYMYGMDAYAPLHFGNALRERAKKELRGKDLACFCPLDQPCHADVLLEIANSD